MAEYSAFRNKRKHERRDVPLKSLERALPALYALHGFLLEKEARAKRRRISQKDFP